MMIYGIYSAEAAVEVVGVVLRDKETKKSI